MANEQSTTAATLGEYRKELARLGFTEVEIQTLVIEAARNLVNNKGLQV